MFRLRGPRPCLPHLLSPQLEYGDRAGEDQWRPARPPDCRRTSPRGDRRGEAQRPPCRRQCRLRPAVAALAAPADLILAEMMEGARILGRLAEAVSRLEVVVRPVAEVAVRVRTDRVADGQTMMEAGTTEDLTLAALAVPEAEGAQEAPEAEGALAVREEEEAPQMRVMTVDEGVAASTPTSRKS